MMLCGPIIYTSVGQLLKFLPFHSFEGSMVLQSKN